MALRSSTAALRSAAWPRTSSQLCTAHTGATGAAALSATSMALRRLHSTAVSARAGASSAAEVCAWRARTQPLAWSAPRSAALPRRGLRTTAAAREGEAAGGASEGEKRIVQILTDKFQPSTLEVADTSGGCGAFYSIVISSKAFKGITTIKAHRMVNEELKNIISGIHGLQLKTIAED